MNLIDKIKQLFKKPEPARAEHPLDLACAVLLTEVVKADTSEHPHELQRLHDVVKELFKLNDADTKALLIKARVITQQSNDFFQFTDVLNTHWQAEQKFVFLQGLWNVAFSDADLDKYEEHTIRKISDLLYVPHSEFIRAKLSVRPGSSDYDS